MLSDDRKTFHKITKCDTQVKKWHTVTDLSQIYQTFQVQTRRAFPENEETYWE